MAVAAPVPIPLDVPGGEAETIEDVVGREPEILDLGEPSEQPEAYDPDQPTAAEYLQEHLQATINAALEALLIAAEKDSEIKPVPWLATYLKDHNIPNTRRREYEARESAASMVMASETRDEVFRNCPKALRSVLWPCTACVAIIDREYDEEVECDPPPKPEPTEEELEAARLEAEAKAAEEAAALEAARPKSREKKAPPKKGKEPEPEPEPEQPEPEPEPEKFYKTVRSTVLRYVSTSHIDPSSIDGQILRKGQGVTWAALVRGGRTLKIDDVTAVPQVHFFGDAVSGSYAAVPLYMRQQIIGVVTIDTLLSGRTISADQLEFIERVVELAGHALDSALDREEAAAAAREEEARHAAEAALAAEAAALAAEAEARERAEREAEEEEEEEEGDEEGEGENTE